MLIAEVTIPLACVDQMPFAARKFEVNG